MIDIENIKQAALISNGEPMLISASKILELITRLESAEQHAAMYQFLASQATQQADTLGPIFRIDIRRDSESTLFNFYSAVSEAMKEMK